MEMISDIGRTSPKMAIHGFRLTTLDKPIPQYYQGLFGDFWGLVQALHSY
jgi:hypothetical protein